MTQEAKRSVRSWIKLFTFILPRWAARVRMTVILFLSDIASLLISGIVALFIWSHVRTDLIFQSYLNIIYIVLVFSLVYGLAGLYPGIGLGPVEELRHLSISTTVVFLWLGTLTFYLHTVEQYSRASFGMAWLFALVLVPAGRHLIRTICVSMGLWGEPIALIGYGERGKSLLSFLLNNPKLGYRPVLVINGYSSSNLPELPIPHYFDNGQLPFSKIRDLDGIRTAMIITTEIPQELLAKIVDGYWHKFHHLILIDTSQTSSSVWIEPRDIGGVLGLEVRQNLFSNLEQGIKRVIDILLVVPALPVLILLFAILAILIRIDTPGPIIYTQKRLGKEGEEFTIWKFRTMVLNADEVLAQYLKKHPTSQAEWNDNQKIKDDPRITAVGKMLRRLSLDELPQFVNILQGKMSLVGPRPIVQEEIPNYGIHYHLYCKVKPGLTGLWQISGRNDLNYDERVNLDKYYVRNWSVWMDIYILAATIKAVLTGKGAY